MDATKVDSFLISRSENFPTESTHFLRESLLAADESKYMMLMSAEFKSPIISLVLGLVCGSWGIDRFYIGDTGLGLAKLITCGGLGVWTIIDWFLIMKETKRKNMEKIQLFL